MGTDQELGARLRKARETKGIGAKEAARRMGIAYSTLMNHEGGHRGSKRRLSDYARVYSVNLSWLSTNSGPMKGHDPLFDDVQALEPRDRETVEALITSLKNRRTS